MPEAWEPGVTTNARMIGAGTANLLDTYLSQETFKGWNIGYISETTRRSRKHAGFSYLLTHRGIFCMTDNKADNNHEMSGMYDFRYAIHYNWPMLNNRLLLHAGAGIGLDLGFIYNTHGSNNPAQAKLALHLSPSAGVNYKFRIGTRSFTANYDLAFPLLGVMFSPNYGQSYYEIFNRGDYDHNIVPTTIGCTPSMSHALSLDIPVGSTAMRIGYTGNFRQSDVNNLKYHSYEHMFIIGIVKHFTVKNIRP